MTTTTFNPFTVEYPRFSTPIKSFRYEAVQAVDLAVSKNKENLPVVVMMSGGIDSELVGQAFIDARSPFLAVIGRLVINTPNHVQYLNTHDIKYAEAWCQTNMISVFYCDIDVYQDANKLCKYALDAQGFSPQYACHMMIMKWCSDNRMFFVAGNGEMDFVLYENEYHMLDEQREHTLGNFCNAYTLRGVWQFWKQDARCAAAFLELPTVKHLMRQRAARLLTHKYACFSDVYKIEARPKYTGFEYIQEWDSILRTRLKLDHDKFDEKFYTPLDSFRSC